MLKNNVYCTIAESIISRLLIMLFKYILIDFCVCELRYTGFHLVSICLIYLFSFINFGLPCHNVSHTSYENVAYG